MSGISTETALRDWRFGQAQAERLTAALLHLQGFEDVDPQHPLGGPDGLKDVLCRRNSKLWVAAAYFPPTRPSFAGIKKKFTQDVAGVAANGAAGFAFFVNQPISISERQTLVKLCPDHDAEIYHLERLVGILNSPKGCGLRLEYLRIPMTEEEQWSFWSEMNADLARKVGAAGKRQQDEMQLLTQKVDFIARQTVAMNSQIGALPSTIRAMPRLPENAKAPTSLLSVHVVRWLHRIVTATSGVPTSGRGRFRGVDVKVGTKGSNDPHGTFTPISHRLIDREMASFLDWWHKEHRVRTNASKTEITLSLATFHHRFFVIHPFVDGNGRVARLLLDQAARELLKRGIREEFTSPPGDYYATLAAADDGDFGPLQQRIELSLE